MAEELDLHPVAAAIAARAEALVAQLGGTGEDLVAALEATALWVAEDEEAVAALGALGAHQKILALLSSGDEAVMAAASDAVDAAAASVPAGTQFPATAQEVTSVLAEYVNSSVGPLGDPVELCVRRLREKVDASKSIGNMVWTSGVVLARWVCQNPTAVRDLRALEIGAGLGFAGLAASRYAKAVTITDYDPLIVSNLAYNARRHSHLAGAGCRCSAAVLDWERLDGEAEARVGECEVLLGADVVHEEPMADGVMRVMRLLPPSAVAYIVNPRAAHRAGVARFQGMLDAEGFRWSAVPIDDDPLLRAGLEEETQDIKLEIYTIRPPPQGAGAGPGAGRTGRFVSTRGSGPGRRVYSFEEAVLAGWADDGGMILPEAVPALSRDTLRAWAKLPYPRLVAEFLQLFAEGEVPREEMRRICDEAFGSQFGIAEGVRLAEVAVGDDRPHPTIHVAELWHGPTLAFKDLGLQVLGRLLDFLLGRRGERLSILVGTSGDTGSAAIEAVVGTEHLDIQVLYPSRAHSNVSRVQELQMTRHADTPGVTVVRVEGGSDDLDVPMTEVFADVDFKRRHRLGSMNSVNIARVLVQCVHSFYCYLQLCPEADRPATLVVPTGAAGHIVSTLLAARAGLPMRACAATNENDCLHTFLETGVLRLGEVRQTIASAMDVQMPYNVERLLYLACGDGSRVRSMMEGFKSKGLIEMPPEDLAPLRALGLVSASVGDGRALAAMAEVHARAGYLVDPHTAIGVAVALNGVPSSRPGEGGEEGEGGRAWVGPICMACAHPAKFPDTVARALGCTAAEAVAAMPDRDSTTVGPVVAMAEQGEWEGQLRAMYGDLHGFP